MTGPLVSVVVPVHDVRTYLEPCLSSLAQQTYTSFEVILVDDGSTDASGDICDGWVQRDARFRVIHQAQAGSSVARNRGMDAARGDYLLFVDADDLVSPKMIEILVRAAEREAADIALGEIASFDEQEGPTFTEEESAVVSSAEDALMDIICVRPRWGPMAKLLRRQLLEGGPRFPVGLLHQDLAFVPEVFARAAKVVQVAAVVYAHRERAGSVTDSVQRGGFSPDLITILRGNIELARRTTAPDNFDTFLAAYVRHATRHAERIRGAAAWHRNRAFVIAYRSFVRDYLREILALRSWSLGRRLLIPLAIVSPRAYSVVVRAVQSGRQR